MTRRGVQQFDSAGSCYKIKYESEVTYMATIIKGSTKRGKCLINTACRYQGTRLVDVYTNWSKAKQNAYDDCLDEYRHTENHTDFRICSHNTNFFSVSWCGLFGGERAVFLKTGKTDYIILLDK